MQEFLNYIIEPYSTYQNWQIYLEIIATVLGISSVLFSMKRNIWVYPTGIISTGIYIYLLFNWGLYGDTMINLYYLIMSIYGWFIWSNNADDKVHVTVEYMNRKDWVLATFLFLGSLALVMTIYYFRPVLSNGFDLSKIAESGFNYKATDYIDACTTGIFLIGMWLMARRKVENWAFWIIGDLISVPLYIIKGYAITSFQYLVFTGLAILGYMAWKKAVNQAKNS